MPLKKPVGQAVVQPSKEVYHQRFLLGGTATHRYYKTLAKESFESVTCGSYHDENL